LRKKIYHSFIAQRLFVKPDRQPAMRTRDLDEITMAVSKVYCPHTVEVTVGRGVDAVLAINQQTFQPLVGLSYNAPVKIHAGNFPRLFLMMHCTRGAASAGQEGERAEWREGQTLPLSAGLDTDLLFNKSFAQKGLRLDVDRLERLCGRLLGHPLDEPLRFALSPFSAEFERTWRHTLLYLSSWQNEALQIPEISRAALDEYLLTLLLHQHPHNYSDALAKIESPAIPSLIRRAERFMSDNAMAAITVSDVAAHLGISLRSLQSGLRQWRGTTPNALLRQIRLQHARDELSRPGAGDTVTAIALRYGFSHLGRFSALYRSAFGETPISTLRRSRK
jgi:AraC-like DNA-binding protein